jgi:hypothetical protein
VTTYKSLGLLAKDGSVECMFYELNEETVEGVNAILSGCLIRYRPYNRHANLFSIFFCDNAL